MKRDRVLAKLAMQRVVVTTTEGATFDGLLADVDERTFRLVNARLIGDQTQAPRPLDGELFLERSRVAFMQKP